MRSSYLDHMRRVLEGESGRQIACVGKVMRQSRVVLLERMTITNDCNLAGGENVGGCDISAVDSDGDHAGASSTRSAAPEGATSDEDGGDGDPDPERRGHSRSATVVRSAPAYSQANAVSNPCRLNLSRSEANMDQSNAIPFVVEHFDRVSDSTHIDIAALKAITGKSRATLYRWIDKGILPKPRKLGPTHNFWTAGDIRRALSA